MEEEYLRKYLTGKYSEILINKAITDFKKASIVNTHDDLYPINREVYSLLRYGVKVKEEADVVAPIAQPINQQQEIEVKKAPEPAKQAIPSTAPNGTYVNVDGNNVPRPYAAPSAPAGASARCRDGTYSFSQHRSGTCSHHGGVAVWF